MPRTKISEFSATAGSNTDIDGINISEGCAPSGINDAIRELMAQLKDFQAGTAGDSFNGPVGTTTAAAGAFTSLSASGTFALTGDQVQISEGGTGQTTANAAFNALAPSQTSNAGKYLKTDGTNTSWDALDISTADITGTLPVANGGTGLTSFTANRVFYASSTSAIGQSANLTFDGTTLTANALTTTGNTTLGDASTDTVQVNGYMGVGGAASSDVGVYITSPSLVGASQYGIWSAPVANTSATSLVVGALLTKSTAAASFTTSNAISLRIGNGVKGAGSTITSNTGIEVLDQTNGTNNYGITSLVSSGTNKWNIYASGTAANYFAGKTLQGSTTIPSGGSITSLLYSTSSSGLQISSSTGGAALVSNSGGGLQVSAQTGSVGSETYTLRFTLGTTEAVFNDPGNDYDFRVESDTNTHAFFVQGSDGNVGIGTSSPNAKLQVTNGTAGRTSYSSDGDDIVIDSTGSGSGLTIASDRASYGVIYFADQDSGTRGIVKYDHVDNSLLFGTSGTERLRIDSSGNVGIGTSSPGAKLDIKQSGTNWYDGVRIVRSTNDNQRLALGNTSGASYIASIDATGGTNNALLFGRSTNGTTFTESARFDSSGNLGLGGTSFGGGAVVMFLANATTVPASNPSGGGVLYVEGGALKYRGSSGTVTTIAAA